MVDTSRQSKPIITPIGTGCEGIVSALSITLGVIGESVGRLVIMRRVVAVPFVGIGFGKRVERPVGRKNSIETQGKTAGILPMLLP